MDPNTGELPFLVVHGGLVWRAILAVAVAALCGAAWLLRRRAAHAQKRAALRELEGRSRREGERVLRGTLGGADGAAAATLRAEGRRGERAVASWRAGELWIETEDGRVLLGGGPGGEPAEELLVTAGSRAAAARNGVPALAAGAHLEAARAGAPWLHRVRPFRKAETLTATIDVVGPGDRVVVRGRLERTPSAAPSGYRDGAVTWILHPAAEDQAIEVAACLPRAAVARMARGALVLALAGAALGSWVVLKVLGERWIERCVGEEPRQAADGPLALADGHACVLAAAMPGTRDVATSWLYRLLEGDPYRDEHAVRRLAAAAGSARGCSESAAVLLRHARFEDAARQARACGDPHAESTALLALGRFDEAARIHAPATAVAGALPHTPALIAAGRWFEAALQVRVRADAVQSEAGDASARVRGLRCLEELLRAHGGDLDAEPRLRALDAEEPGRCAPMLAELASGDERRRLLQGAARSRAGEQLAWAAGVEDTGWEPQYAESVLAELDDDDAARSAHLAWLVASERGGWEHLPPHHRAALLRWRAVAQVLDGDAGAAVATARAAVAAMPEDDDRAMQPRFLRFMPAAAALYTPATELDPGLDLELEHERSQQPMDQYFSRLMLRGAKSPYERQLHDVRYRAALTAARAGDGGPLAELMGQPYQRWQDGDVIAVLPRIRTGREAIARQLAWLPRQHPAYALFPDDPSSIWQLAIQAVVRREGMKLAGATAEAARWDAIYRRFDAVLGDRRRLVALMLWSD